MMDCRKEVSCRNLFQKLKILRLMSQYILSLVMFIINNKSQFTINSEIRDIITTQHTNLHQPTLNLLEILGVRVYNKLPTHIKKLSDDPKNFEL